MEAAKESGSNIDTACEEILRQLRVKTPSIAKHFQATFRSKESGLAPRDRKEIALILWMQQAAVAPHALSHGSFANLEKGIVFR
jgi:hypothetical protein